MAADPRIRAAESKAAVTVAASGCGAPAAGTGTFLSALPQARKPELRLDEIGFRDAACHRFRRGLPNMHPSRVHGHGHWHGDFSPAGALVLRGQTWQAPHWEAPSAQLPPSRQGTC